MVAYLPLIPNAAPQHRAWALLTAGWIANDQADLKSAEAFLTAAITLAREVSDENVLVHGMLFLGPAALECGDLARVWGLLIEARARELERDPRADEIPVDEDMAEPLGGGYNNAPDGPGEPTERRTP